MNQREVHQLLIEASAIDNRNVTDLTVKAWHPVLARFDYRDAVLAMREHFASSTDYLMPAHIAIGCRRIIRDRGPLPPAGKRWAVDVIEGPDPLTIEGGQHADRS